MRKKVYPSYVLPLNKTALYGKNGKGSFINLDTSIDNSFNRFKRNSTREITIMWDKSSYKEEIIQR